MRCWVNYLCVFCVFASSTVEHATMWYYSLSIIFYIRHFALCECSTVAPWIIRLNVCVCIYGIYVPYKLEIIVRLCNDFVSLFYGIHPTQYRPFLFPDSIEMSKKMYQNIIPYMGYISFTDTNTHTHNAVSTFYPPKVSLLLLAYSISLIAY